VSYDLFLKAPLGLLPVLVFLFVLMYLDVYKLVRIHFVIWVVLGGTVTAIASYFGSGLAMDAFHIEFSSYSRYVAPLIEESIKGLVIVYLLRSNRIGFLVDSAIMGFAVGTGFAMAENLYYLYLAPDAGIAVWVIRGFGTAVMHGGVTAIFAVLALSLGERYLKAGFLIYLPALLAASILHGIFNQFPLSPVFSTVATLLLLPLILWAVFQKSVSAMHDWLEVDFDANEEILEKIHTGQFTHSRAGRFLLDLRERFDGLVLADMLCYVRLHVELTMRAKGMLLAREYGMDVQIDEDVREKFVELHELESNIGKAGMLAIKPYINLNRKELWQLFMLEGQG
jgi:RsiW-degrading membrane proteinase PrsW (M82 family)